MSSRHAAFGRELIIKKTTGIEKVHTELLNFLRDGAKDRFRISTFQREENAGRFKVWMESSEQAFRGNLSRHDRIACLEMFQCFQHLSELTDQQAAPFVFRKRIH